MFRKTTQRGLLTVFYGGGSKPLALWDIHVGNGYIERFMAKDIHSMVMEIGAPNVSTTYMTCPKGKETLGIRLPFLILVVKNIKKYFSFEVTILDDTYVRRRFRASNFQSSTIIHPLSTAMPIGLSEGWNQIQFNLEEFTRRAYKKQYLECVCIKVNANIQIRRIYFAEKLVSEDELPKEYKLFFPITKKHDSEKRLSAGSKQGIKALAEKVSSKTEFAQPAEGEEGEGGKDDMVRTASQIAAKERRESQSVRRISETSKKSQLSVIKEGRASASPSVVNLPTKESELEGEGEKETEGDADIVEVEGERGEEADKAEGESEPPAEGDNKGPEAPVEGDVEGPLETEQVPVEAPPEEVPEAAVTD